jgi:regulator of protease activity HflC (stomatin/prohibitin superfamily)
MRTYWILVGLTLFLSSLYLVLSSIVTIDSSTVGFVFRWKKFRRVITPGLNFIIPVIEKVEIHSTATRQMELPDEPENIDRVSEVAPPGKKLPFRVPHKGMEEAYFYVKEEYDVNARTGNPFDNTLPLHKLKLVRFHELPDQTQKAMQADPLNAPLTSEPPVAFEWHLKADDEKSIRDFIENVSPEAGRDRETEVRKRAEDTVSRILQEYLAPTTLGHAIYMAPLFSKLIKEELEILVGEKPDPKTGTIDRPWGIHIGEAFLKPFIVGRTINTARAEAAAAVSRKQDAIRISEGEAEATRNKAAAAADATRLQAEADRESEVKKGEGEAGRIAAMAKVWATNPQAQVIAELDVKERGYEAYEKNTTVTTYAPGANSMLPLRE